MEDFPTLQGPRNSTMGLEVISPSVGQGEVTVIKILPKFPNHAVEVLQFIPEFRSSETSCAELLSDTSKKK